MILEKYRQKNLGEVCYLAAMADILAFYGINVEEKNLFVMTTGLNLYIRMKQSLAFKCMDIVNDYEQYELLMSRFGIKINMISILCSNDAESIIVSELTQNRPIMICCDTYSLPYHTEYKRTHAMHIVTVYGYSEKGDTVYISDNYVSALSKRTYYGKIDKASILDYFDSDNNCFIWTLKLDKEAIKSYPTEKEIYAHLTFNCNNFLKSNNILVDNKQDKGEIYCGIRAIEMANECLRNVEQFNETICEDLFNLYKSINVGGGVTSARILMAQYVMEISCKHDLTDFYIALSDKWKKTANLLYKAIYSKKLTYLEKCADNMEILRNMESEGAEKLIKRCKDLG